MPGVTAGGVDLSHLHSDRRISLVAERQHGVILREQLAMLGIGRGAVQSRVRRGLLRPRYDGVYLWCTPSPTTDPLALAATAAAGIGANVTHEWALAVWELRPRPNGPVDVTVLGRRIRFDGIRAHQCGSLHPDDVRRLRGIPVTAPARSLLDSAATLTPRGLAGAVEQAQIRRLVTKDDLNAAIERSPRRPGVRALRALVDDDPAFTRARSERKLVALLRAARLPEPIFNTYVDGFEVDALWPRHRVVLEFDSYTFHATRAAFERDRRKTAALTRGRHLVLRTTWRELTRESHALIARTAEALARAPTAA